MSTPEFYLVHVTRERTCELRASVSLVTVKDSLLEMTLLTTAMCACLIVNTVTLLMVVIVLCRLRKREHQATPIDNAHQEQKMGKEGMEHQGAENWVAGDNELYLPTNSAPPPLMLSSESLR